MEIRDIEIFLTLAEELHFGRTAERLHVSSARVSQAIKKQERAIGTPLFVRSSRNVQLTPAGERLRGDLRQVYRDLQASLERARHSARTETAVLRLGMFSWNLDDVRPHFDALAERHPGSEIQVRHIPFGDPFAALRAGELDAIMPWLPIREPDLTVGPIVFTEPIVLAMSSDDPLAEQDSVSYEDFADRSVIGGATPDYWRETFIPTHTPSGRPIRIGPTAASFDQMVPIILTGEAVGPVTAQARHLAPHPGIAYPLVRDAAPVRFTLVWRTAAETDLTRTFADIIAEHGPIAL